MCPNGIRGHGGHRAHREEKAAAEENLNAETQRTQREGRNWKKEKDGANWRLEGSTGLRGLEVLHAVAIELLFGELLNKDNLRGNEDRRLPLLVRNSDIDERPDVVVFAALEAQATFGHIFADDDVIAALGMADAGVVSDLEIGRASCRERVLLGV